MPRGSLRTRLGTSTPRWRCVSFYFRSTRAIRLTLSCFFNLQEAATRAGQNPNFAQAPQQEQVTVERAVCQILMGRIEDAAYTLGLTQEQLAYGMADPQVER